MRWSDATYLEDQDMWRLRWGLGLAGKLLADPVCWLAMTGMICPNMRMLSSQLWRYV
jgi:hypothetical protein